MHHIPPAVLCVHQAQPIDYRHLFLWLHAGEEGRNGRGICIRPSGRHILGQRLGFYMLLFAVIGYMNGFFRRLFYDDDIKLPIALIGASELIYGLVTYFCLYMLQGNFAFTNCLTHIILPELVYTILITLVLYQIILHINKKLEAEEQRSASKFV